MKIMGNDSIYAMDKYGNLFTSMSFTENSSSSGSAISVASRKLVHVDKYVDDSDHSECHQLMHLIKAQRKTLGNLVFRISFLKHALRDIQQSIMQIDNNFALLFRKASSQNFKNNAEFQ